MLKDKIAAALHTGLPSTFVALLSGLKQSRQLVESEQSTPPFKQFILN